MKGDKCYVTRGDRVWVGGFYNAMEIGSLYVIAQLKPAHDDSTFVRRAHLGIGEVVNEGEDGCRVGQLLLWPAC